MKLGLSKMAVVMAGVICAIPFLSACGPQVINVSESEDFHMTLSAATANAGEVTFHVTNNATDMQHEFVIVQTDLAMDKLPLGDDGNVDEDKINHLDEVEDISPGESKDLKITLAPGHYVFMCNLPAHYTQGMRAEFTVK
jgi:uncharacterized cupredoxin-like copper-binding protein